MEFKIGDRVLINDKALTEKYRGKTATVLGVRNGVILTDIEEYGFSFNSKSLTMIYRGKGYGI